VHRAPTTPLRERSCCIGKRSGWPDGNFSLTRPSTRKNCPPGIEQGYYRTLSPSARRAATSHAGNIELTVIPRGRIIKKSSRLCSRLEIRRLLTCERSAVGREDSRLVLDAGSLHLTNKITSSRWREWKSAGQSVLPIYSSACRSPRAAQDASSCDAAGGRRRTLTQASGNSGSTRKLRPPGKGRAALHSAGPWRHRSLQSVLRKRRCAGWPGEMGSAQLA